MNTITLYSNQHNIDFYAEVDNDSDADISETETETDSNKCLITLLPLTENHIVLKCGHAFNYDPIFKDVYNHKKKFQNLEGRRIGDGELRCPYCRNVQRQLLPVTQGRPRIYGINTLDNADLLISSYMSNPSLFHIYFQKYSSGRCCNAVHSSQIMNGFSEYLITCTNNKVKYHSLTGLIFCPDHFIENTNKKILHECDKYAKIIDIMNESIQTIKGPERQRTKTKITMLSLMRDNFIQYIDTVKCTETANKTEIESDGYDCTNHPTKTKLQKYAKHSQCFAYLTSGKSKNERCKLEVYDKDCMYCTKHNKVIADIIASYTISCVV